MNKNSRNWICCQIGAREHYAIPRALHQHEKLAHLITDAWVTPVSPLKILTQSGLRERFHPALAKVQVHAFNSFLIRFEISQKLQKRFGWETIIARNNWFQQQAIKKLTQLTEKFTTPPILFSYSYAALELFKFAKKQGWYTVLGQIDPGLWEEQIVIQESEKHPQYHKNWQPALREYWQIWQEECNLADAIVVNSHWSSQLLEKTGIEVKKIHIIPLVYTPPKIANKFIRTYPESFSQKRPLRVLFLGQVILRKGIASVLESIKSLEGYPIEFWIVGSKELQIPSYFENHPQVHWVGRVNRSETAKYYQLADVFLFPTLSDGFGLTQLEAQAWQLPIIASRNCGEVVVDGVNGWLLPEVSNVAIANILKLCLHDPENLTALSKNCQITNKFTLETLTQHLLKF
ncbi:MULTISPECIES: glycosyltransferase family 4 protein [unclassified Nodularia (in: cyanobacteria)]|uniref:glycosyltransferase family 4 protein n=1 Tax=unclassified Nodularia (in: cyanobacteria) TaxID=2656917 RepID=UPI00187E1ED0|nr:MULTISPECIES: glycosyltransferase family 4 protein [unclassified Nodularia (in: cyanobacteria)]MBE9199418.1 glycosyltransferase family 4 protein [Nodularia sp. LEGE 06071]MCC2692916.1 glycosyltransferase family 4 protein [Nodularia sp. LEGE 04288]